MTNVRELLRAKPGFVWSIAPQSTVYEALQLMAEKEIGALLVVENDKLIGIFSERDYARKCILKGKASNNTPVQELMTEVVYYMKPEQTIEECMSLMTNKRIRHLPVMENDRLIGIVSIGDVVKEIISEQETTIQQLENYITGRGYIR